MSEQVDIGLRLFLQDAATSGLGVFGATLAGLGGTVSTLSGRFLSSFGNINTRIAALSTAISDGKEKLALYAEHMSILSDRMTLARQKVTDLMAAGVPFSDPRMQQAVINVRQLGYEMDQVSVQSGQMATQMANADAELQKMQDAKAAQDTMRGVAGVTIAAGVAFAGFAAALGYSLDQAAKLEQTMQKVRVGVKGTETDYTNLKLAIIDAANNSIFSTDQLAKGIILLGERGYTAAQIVSGNMVNALRDFAEATKSEVEPATELLSSIMAVYGANAQDAAHYADVLTSAYYNGIPSVQEMSTAMGQVAGKAAELGIPIGDLASTLDVLVRKGQSASQAGTSLRYMLATLTDPIPKAQKELADLGILVINSTTPAFKQFTAELTNTADASKKTPAAFDGTLTSLQAMFTQAQKLNLVHTDKTFYQWAIQMGFLSDKLYDATGNFGGIDNMIRQLGTALDKIKDPSQKAAAIQQLFNVRSGQGADLLLQQWKDILKKIDDLNNQAAKNGNAQKAAKTMTDSWKAMLQELGTTMNDFAALVGSPMLAPIKNLVSGFNGLMSNLIKTQTPILGYISKFLLLGAAISGAVFIVGMFALALLALHIPLVTTLLVIGGIALGIVLLVAGFRYVQPVLGPVADALQRLGGEIGSQVSQAFKQIGGALSAARDQIQPVMPQLQLLGKALAVVGGIVVLVFGAAIMGVIMGVIGALKMVIIGIIQVVTGVAQVIGGIIQVFEGFFHIIHGLFTGNRAELAAGFHKIVDGLGNIAKGGLNMILGLFTGTFGAVLAAAAGFGRGIFGFFSSIFHTIDDTMRKAKLAAEIHSLEQKNKTLEHARQTELGSAKHLLDLYNDTEKQFRNCHNAAEREALAAKLAVLAHARQMALDHAKHLGDMERWNLEKMKRMKEDAAKESEAWYVKLIDNAKNMAIGFENWVGELPGKIGGFFSDMIGGVSQKMHQFVEDMLHFGAGIISNLIKGIQNGLGQLGSAMDGVGHTIMSFLPHSPADQGPLRNIEKPMPAMMRMLAQGIRAHSPLVHEAMDVVAGSIQNRLSPNGIGTLYRGGSVPNGGGGHAETHIHLQVGSKEVAECILDHYTGQLKMNGLGRAYV